MGKGIRYLESSATPEEDSYGYRVEWDDYLISNYDRTESCVKIQHRGPGSRSVSGFDNAWDMFNDYCNNPDYRGVRLIQIDANGCEEIYARK